MPCHFIGDVHERRNLIFTVSFQCLVKIHSRERACFVQRGKKTLLSLTIFFYRTILVWMQNMWEYITSAIPLTHKPQFLIIMLQVGQFGWGGIITTYKRNCLLICSDGKEICCRGYLLISVCFVVYAFCWYESMELRSCFFEEKRR